jgi:hypothetical protein
VTVVFDREPTLDTAYFYLNGDPAGSESSALIAGDSASSPLDVWIGTNSFIGNLDEVRVTSTTRTADWIKTEFNNQTSPSTFYGLGSAVPVTGYFAPTAPTVPYSNDTSAQSGQTDPSGITDPTPAFSAIYNDPDSGDIANRYRVEVNTASDFSGTVMWDSGVGGTSMADTTEGSRSPDIIYAGSNLASSTTYYWRITFYDDDGFEGAASATQNFTTGTIVTTTLSWGENGSRDDFNAVTQDTYLDQGQASYDMGTNGLIRVGDDGSRINRTLIKYNLSGLDGLISNSGQIVSAALKMKTYDNPDTGNIDVDAFRVKKDWFEGTKGYAAADEVDDAATWQYQVFSETQWATAGADDATDRETTSDDVETFSAGITWYSWDVTDSVKYFFDNPASNFGWLLKAQSEGTTKYWRVYSSEAANTANRPYLEITISNDPACGYEYKRAITIDHNEVIGDSGDTLDLVDFPVLIKETGTWLRNSGFTDGRIENVNGYDIIFKNSTETQILAHEIEYYYEGSEAANGDLVAWVKIPSLDADANTIIYMYYGNSCISSETQNKNAVWNANYKGVWHMSEEAAGTGTADLYQDSTSNSNHGDDNIDATGQTGQIDGGQQFDGTDDHALVPDPGGSFEFSEGGLDGGTSDFSISAWVNLDASVSDSFPTILKKGGGSDTSGGYWFNYYKADDTLDLRVSDSTNRFIANSNTGLTLEGTGWHYVCAVFDREAGTDTAYFYFDGNPAGSENSPLIADNSINEDNDLTIGSNDSSTWRAWKGEIDEVRISNVVRTAGWIETSFNNQGNPSGFYNFGNEATTGWVTGSGDPVGSYAVPDGTDRLLVLITAWESAGGLRTITGVTFGGVAMTQAETAYDEGSTSNNVVGVDIWYLKETDIPAGSQSFDITYDGATGAQVHAWMTYENIDQNNPIVDHNTDADTDPVEATVNVLAGGMSVAGAINGITGDSYTWGNGWAETTDEDYTGQVLSTAEHPTATAGTDTASADVSPNNSWQALAVVSLRPAGTGSGTWYNSCWQNRKKLTLNAGLVQADVTDFPVLISFTGDSDLAANAQSDFDDVLFTSADGVTILDHEIEDYNSTNGDIVAWVKIPSLSSSVDTDIYMYYGCGTAENQENPPGVWSNGFEGVWHLHDDFNDSTANANHGTNSSSTDDSPAYIADGQDCNKASGDQYIRIPVSSGSNLENLNEGDYTVQAWFNSDTRPSSSTWSDNNHFHAIVMRDSPDKVTGIGYNHWYKFELTHQLTSGYDAAGWEDTSYSIPTGWRHVTGVVDKTNTYIKVYVDGTNTHTTSPVSAAGYDYGTADWLIGIHNPGGGTFRYAADGQVDEVRLISGVRTAGWIETEFNNQSNLGIGAGKFIKTAGSEEAGGWYGACWQYRKKLTIDSSNVCADLTDFPSLISFTGDSDLAAGAQSDFDDVLFTSSDGTTKLSHEIEDYNSTNGDITAWVKIPSLSSSSDTEIYMYYGCSTAGNQQNASGVWDDDYVGVWHLTESGDGTADEFKDSTQYTNHGQGGEGVSEFVPSQVTGKIANGQDFDNSDSKWELIDCGNDSILDITGNQITLQAWVKHSIVPENGKYYGILNHKGFDYGYRIMFPQNSLKLNFQLPGDTDSLNSAGDVPTGGWHHVVATYDSAKMNIYIDGVKDANERSKTNNIESVPPTENEVWIGHGDQPKDVAWSYPFEGQIDEVRISTIARPQCWIETEYFNINNPGIGAGKFIESVGGEEAGGSPVLEPSGAFNLNTDTTGSRSYADGIVYRIDAGSASGTSVDRYSGSDDLSNGVSASSITFSSSIQNSYDGTTAANQKVVIQRVPNYISVTLDSGDTITASAWDGLTTTPAGTAGYYSGIVAFRSAGAVTVDSGASIDVDGLGYMGGDGGSSGASPTGGINGESYDGTNGSGGQYSGGTRSGTYGGGAATYDNGSSNTTGQRGGGGGGGGCRGDLTDENSGGAGAGGGYGGGGAGGGGGADDTWATDPGDGGLGGTLGVAAGGGGGAAANGYGGDGGDAGSSGSDSTGSAPVGPGGAAGSGSNTGTGGGTSTYNADSSGAGGGGGGLYGTSDLSTLFSGSGGGGGGGQKNGAGAAGGDGGGIIFIIADSVTNSGTISARGTAGGDGGDDPAAYGAGGGGSGGSILMEQRWDTDGVRRCRWGTWRRNVSGSGRRRRWYRSHQY